MMREEIDLPDNNLNFRCIFKTRGMTRERVQRKWRRRKNFEQKHCCLRVLKAVSKSRQTFYTRHSLQNAASKHCQPVLLLAQWCKGID
jgi:hypothetical protein